MGNKIELQETIDYAEYLNMAHEQHVNNKKDKKSNDHIINLSDYIPEPKSLYQILKLRSHQRQMGNRNQKGNSWPI